MKFRFACAVAALGILVATPAQSADLGGNCCADLEERIAELEATTVRKGNRKVSLTVSGHINEAVMFWNDGEESNVYQGTNDVQRSRFRFVGEAKIVDGWKAGYLLEFGARTNRLPRTNQDVSNTFTDALDLRHSVWYVDSKQLGRVSVGLTSQATDDITEINTANLRHFARPSLSKWNSGFFLLTENGIRTTNVWRDVQPSDGVSGDNVPGEGDRRHEIRYDTPVWEGFRISAAWGEDDFWDTALRYSNDKLAGFKFEAGIGYAQYTDASGGANLRGCANLNVIKGGFISFVEFETECETLGMSASLMHEDTGLFFTAAYGQKVDSLRQEAFERAGVIDVAIDDKDQFRGIQAGIERKFIELGKTTIYGEYWRSQTGAQIGDASGIPLSFQSVSDALGLGFGTALASSTEARYWGIGLNQQISAAAMDIYVGYRHHEANAHLFDAGATASRASVNFKELDLVMTGAKIQF